MVEMRKTADIAPFGLRLPPKTKDELFKAARHNGRSLNAEIVARLVWSLQYEKTSLTQREQPQLVQLKTEQEGKIYSAEFTELEIALLETFRKMPVENQLALLTLFK